MKSDIDKTKIYQAIQDLPTNDQAVKQAVTKLVEAVVGESLEPTYHIGQRFTVSSSEEYILAQSATRQCCLIGLKNGNRWHDGIKVGVTSAITSAELRAMSGGNARLIS